MKHTALPWTFRYVGFTHKDVIFKQGAIMIHASGLNEEMSKASSLENLKFIVKAVNSHDKLVNTLKEVEYFLTQIDPVHWPSKRGARQEIEAIRQALKEAE